MSTGNSRQNTFKSFTPKGIRIPVSSVKGRCPRPLDDGGFDVNTVNLGSGLSNMEKRISEIGGKIKIISKLNSGTEIKALIQKNTPNDL